MSTRSAVSAAVAVAAAVGAMAAGAGCGATNDRAQVRDTLGRMARATAARDYRTLCERVLAPSMLAPLRSFGMTCEQALSQGLGGVQGPRMIVRRIEVHGSKAAAAVHSFAANQPASDDTIELVEVGGQWRVSSLGAPAPGPAAARSVASKSVRAIGPRHGERAPASR